MHLSATPRADATSLQALCGTERRAFIPPIDLNRPDVVPLKRGRPGTRQRSIIVIRNMKYSVAKKIVLVWLPQCRIQQGHYKSFLY